MKQFFLTAIVCASFAHTASRSVLWSADTPAQDIDLDAIAILQQPTRPHVPAFMEAKRPMRLLEIPGTPEHFTLQGGGGGPDSPRTPVMERMQRCWSSFARHCTSIFDIPGARLVRSPAMDPIRGPVGLVPAGEPPPPSGRMSPHLSQPMPIPRPLGPRQTPPPLYTPTVIYSDDDSEDEGEALAAPASPIRRKRVCDFWDRCLEARNEKKHKIN